MHKEDRHAERPGRRETLTSILWWAALILSMGSLLGLNTLLDP